MAKSKRPKPTVRVFINMPDGETVLFDDLSPEKKTEVATKITRRGVECVAAMNGCRCIWEDDPRYTGENAITILPE